MGTLLRAVVDCANELNRSRIPACAEANIRSKHFEGGKQISKVPAHEVDCPEKEIECDDPATTLYKSKISV
jgi:hypothetical protein